MLVNFIIPVYNGEKFIKESVESCFNQTIKSKCIGVIIVNDGSVDKTGYVLKRLSEEYKNLKIINFDNNKGKVAAINEAVKNIDKDCQYIFIQAADDICLPYRVEESISLMDDNTTLIFGDMIIIDKDKKLLFNSYWEKFNIKPEEYNNYIEKLTEGNFMSGGTMCINSKYVDDIFPIPEKLKFEDWWIAFKCTLCGQVKYTKLPLIYYRQHDSNDNLSINPKNIKDVVKRELKLAYRNIDYYMEFNNLIKNNYSFSSKINSKVKENINYNELFFSLLFIRNLINRYKYYKKYTKVDIKRLSIKKIIKIIMAIIFGNKFIFIKNFLKLFKTKI